NADTALVGVGFYCGPLGEEEELHVRMVLDLVGQFLVPFEHCIGLTAANAGIPSVPWCALVRILQGGKQRVIVEPAVLYCAKVGKSLALRWVGAGLETLERAAQYFEFVGDYVAVIDGVVWEHWCIG